MSPLKVLSDEAGWATLGKAFLNIGTVMENTLSKVPTGWAWASCYFHFLRNAVISNSTTQLQLESAGSENNYVS